MPVASLYYRDVYFFSTEEINLNTHILGEMQQWEYDCDREFLCWCVILDVWFERDEQPIHLCCYPFILAWPDQPGTPNINFQVTLSYILGSVSKQFYLYFQYVNYLNSSPAARGYQILLWATVHFKLVALQSAVNYATYVSKWTVSMDCDLWNWKWCL